MCGHEDVTTRRHSTWDCNRGQRAPTGCLPHTLGWGAHCIGLLDRYGSPTKCKKVRSCDICTISTMRLVFLHDGLTQSPSEAVPLDLWRVLEYNSPWTGSPVALWEEVVPKSLCPFTGMLCKGVSSSDFVGVLNCLLRASNHALLAVCGSQV